MNKVERLNSPESRYQKSSAIISQVVKEKELGYIYTFPDKRLYERVDNSSSFIQEAWKNYEGGLGIYVHVPYCTPKPPPVEVREQMKRGNIPSDGRDHLCGYCNLFTVVAKEVPSGFTDSLTHEIDLYKPIFQKKMQPTSIYLGGGSPSLLPVEDIKRVVRKTEDLFGKVPNNKERSIECIPDSVDFQKLQALREIGFNRVSIGVQTFNKDALHYSGRNYDPQLGYDAVKNAMDLGFLNVNADIIIGLPSSTQQTFLRDVELIKELKPHTVTLYQDMTRPVTRFGKMKEYGILPQVSQQEIYEWSDIADEQLKANGYNRKSLTCWVSENSWGYQQGEEIYEGIPIIGFGPGARSYGPNAHYSTEYTVSTKLINYSIHKWREKVDQNQFPDIYGYALNPDIKKRAKIILGLMSSQGVDRQEFGDLFDQELEALTDTDMIYENSGRWKYTETGKTYSGALSKIFFGEEIEEKLKLYEHR